MVFSFFLDCQMALDVQCLFTNHVLFSGAQETSCSLGRHCRAELNFEMVVISYHTPKGYPNTYFTPTSTQEILRLRMFLIMDEIREYWTV